MSFAAPRISSRPTSVEPVKVILRQIGLVEKFLRDHAGRPENQLEDARRQLGRVHAFGEDR